MTEGFVEVWTDSVLTSELTRRVGSTRFLHTQCSDVAATNTCAAQHSTITTLLLRSYYVTYRFVPRLEGLQQYWHCDE
jgi:hypothetical protein